MPIRRVLAPSDFSDHSLPSVLYAAEMAEKFGAELILLHVIQDLALVMPDAVMPTPIPAPDIQQLTESARTAIGELVTRHNLDRLKPRVEIRYGSPAAEIVEAAKSLNADLLCISTHGRGGLAHFLLGSVAEKVIRQSPCPVLTVRPKHD
jgi:universal stress protein A